MSLPLTLDEDTAKYMPYNKVSFPKLHDDVRKTAQQCTSELNNMWVVGMLDHEMNTEKEAALGSFAFLTLPGVTSCQARWTNCGKYTEPAAV